MNRYYREANMRANLHTGNTASSQPGDASSVRGQQPKKSVYHPFWDFYRAFFYFSPAEPLFYFRILQFMTRDFSGKAGAGCTLMIVLWGYRGGCRPRTPTSEECQRPRQEAPAADQVG